MLGLLTEISKTHSMRDPCEEFVATGVSPLLEGSADTYAQRLTSGGTSFRLQFPAKDFLDLSLSEIEAIANEYVGPYTYDEH
uniref:Uncharacterized protein n=1 Tax=Arundo donax TaxID=35708 RepID=A0A0A9FAM4_ARUDO